MLKLQNKVIHILVYSIWYHNIFVKITMSNYEFVKDSLRSSYKIMVAHRNSN